MKTPVWRSSASLCLVTLADHCREVVLAGAFVRACSRGRFYDNAESRDPIIILFDVWPFISTPTSARSTGACGGSRRPVSAEPRMEPMASELLAPSSRPLSALHAGEDQGLPFDDNAGDRVIAAVAEPPQRSHQSASALTQQLRQPGEVHRHRPGLVALKQ
jgi:hypothetical protein